ncbi:Hypothetical protein BN2458_PEG2105 [Helicobacter typhlonius]|uniref:Uncharacterized protein n=1 Tax=Helicobacter typhlonius TaxID=76936 RepID=A0A0S4PY94_9HELI|nr:Hypothetical protein BN2458_PEG2105 [Helicobacter typhlonius]
MAFEGDSQKPHISVEIHKLTRNNRFCQAMNLAINPVGCYPAN